MLGDGETAGQGGDGDEREEKFLDSDQHPLLDCQVAPASYNPCEGGTRGLLKHTTFDNTLAHLAHAVCGSVCGWRSGALVCSCSMSLLGENLLLPVGFVTA